MRVLAISNLYPNDAHPMCGIFVRHSLQALSEHCEVHIVVPTPEAEGGGHDVKDGRVAVHRVFYREPRLLKREFTRAWAMRRPVTRAVCEIRRNFTFDLVLGIFLVPGGWLALRESRRYGLPMVAVGLGSDVNLYAGYRVLGSMVRRVAGAASGVVVNARGLVGGCIDLGVEANRVEVLYFGYDPAIFHPANFPDRSTSPPLIVMAANLVEVKQPLVFLRALKLLSDNDLGFNVEIAGEGYLRPEIEEFIADNGLSDKLRLPGAIPQGELARRFRSASVVVLTSRSEGLPFALLEALACGTPVVSSDLPGVREIVHHGENGLLVPVGDVAGFAAAIREAWARDWDHAAIAASVSEFTWARHGERFADLLQRYV